MLIKTTMKYHDTPTKLAIIKKITSSVGENVEKLEPLYTLLARMSNGTATLGHSWQFLKNLIYHRT